MDVIGSVVAIKIMFGTAAIGPIIRACLANTQIIQKEIKLTAAAVVLVPFDYRSE